MATLLYRAEIPKGVHVNTEVVLDQNTFYVIRNDYMGDAEVYPWGYANYRSTDTPIENEHITFFSKELATNQTAVRPGLDYVPQGVIWVYVMNSWFLGDASVSIWSPFDVS